MIFQKALLLINITSELFVHDVEHSSAELTIERETFEVRSLLDEQFVLLSSFSLT